MPILVHYLDGPAQQDKPHQYPWDQLPDRIKIPVINREHPDDRGKYQTAVYKRHQYHDGGRQADYTHVETLDELPKPHAHPA